MPAFLGADPGAFGSFADHLPGAFFRFRTRPDGVRQLDYMSRGCEDVWEMPLDQLEADMASLWGMVDPADLPAMRASIDACVLSGADWDWQWRIRTPSGRRKWLHGLGRVQRMADGTVIWHVFVVDQTDNLVAREQLRASEDRLHQLIEGIPNVAVQGYDADLICRFWNGASERLYGYSAAQAVGTSLLDLIIPDAMRGAVREAVGHMLRTGQAIPSEVLTLKARDGSPVHVHSGHVLVDVPGQPPMFFCIDFDLRERLAAEAMQRALTEQLQQAQKMEALGTLAGGIAHDFNNIVAAILGNTELALGDVPDESPAHVSLTEIRKAARRARSLVQQILTFARRQAQGRVAMDPGEVLRETHGILRSTLPPGVQLRFSVPPQLPAVQGNATQLAQVFLNLVTNAIQAVRGREGAEVVVEAAACPGPPAPAEGSLEVMAPNDRTLRPGLKVVVHDNGHGIEPSAMGRVFEPFFSTKPAGQGSGLGLSVVHGVLMEHGAALQLSSQPGLGTRFVLWLPTTTEQPAAADEAAPPAAPAAPSRHTLLYVDDDEALISLMSRMLARQGYQVESMDNPQDAIDRLREPARRPDVVIVDYNMPQMSGISLARAIRTLDACLPIILTSGHVTDEMLSDARLAGIDHVLEKPDTGRELAGLIAGLVGRHATG
ncbi:PAS domain-containing sensor histidine kinase [uncultured Hydrogenophaga sp.]|uniref:PAS domain-containing sensor histidine kinase n=1 Tax=uncultured Hydrogenophaga sp. TaxID=199683 RepID=UPI00265FA77A|nr:PAS domain-containing sensor histidine kinase [uncultured Hydrogenophaga sp.]